jgi:hypothetical protein
MYAEFYACAIFYMSEPLSLIWNLLCWLVRWLDGWLAGGLAYRFSRYAAF